MYLLLYAIGIFVVVTLFMIGYSLGSQETRRTILRKIQEEYDEQFNTETKAEAESESDSDSDSDSESEDYTPMCHSHSHM